MFGEPTWPSNKNKDVKAEKREKDRMRNSTDLLEFPLKYGDEGYDKIFAGGKIERSNGDWIIKVPFDFPTVAFDEESRNKFDLKNSPVVSEIRDKVISDFKDISLFSGGAHVFIEEQGMSRMVLLRRDMEAKFDPGLLTGPAGRCGEPLSRTTVNETNEELIIIKIKDNGAERLKLLGFFRTKEEVENVINQKLKQNEMIYDYLVSKGRKSDAELLLKVRGEENIEMLDINQFIQPGQDEVKLMAGDRIIDRVSGVAMFDELKNTLEFREILKVTLPDNMRIEKILDGETFGREVVMVTNPDELEGKSLVAALGYYKELWKKGLTF